MGICRCNEAGTRQGQPTQGCTGLPGEQSCPAGCKGVHNLQVEAGGHTCLNSSLMSSLWGSNSSRMRSHLAANHPQTSMKLYDRSMRCFSPAAPPRRPLPALADKQQLMQLLGCTLCCLCISKLSWQLEHLQIRLLHHAGCWGVACRTVLGSSLA